MYDLAILGGGPAGVSAGVYASRKRLSTVFITKNFENQSTVSDDIQNWIGTVSIKGMDFAKNLEEHLRAYANDIVEIKSGESVKQILKNKDGAFTIETDKGEYTARTVLVTTGSHRKKLEGIPGADVFENKGITYCASCDGPLFAGADVAVIGGGNAAFESAAQLLAYAKSVTLFNRGTEFRADPITVKKILENPKMTALTNVQIVEIKGDKFVSSLVYKSTETPEVKEIPLTGIFVEIGSIPTTDFAKNVVKLDQWGHIIIDPRNQRTSIAGVWAAGDCTDSLYHQNNIAAGDAVRALEDIYLFLKAK
ncbi:MAG: FAD-dependent oxidoreductase [Candidatus Taylorbacteria bacterium]